MPGHWVTSKIISWFLQLITYAVIEGLLTKEVPTGIYHMGDDEALSTNQLIAIMCEAMGKQPHIWKTVN